MADQSTIAETTSIVGRIVAAGDLLVQGHVEGSIEVGGELTVASTAQVKSDLHGARVLIAGAVAGDVRASELAVLEAGARVVGDVVAPTVGVRAGALIRGRVDSTGAAAAQPPLGSKTQRGAMAASAPRRAKAARPATKRTGATRATATAGARKSTKAKRTAPAPVMPKATGRGKKAVAKKRKAAAPQPKVPALKKRTKKAARRRAR